MLSPRRRPSPQCAAFIRRWEGRRLVAYKDGNGFWTIGNGHLMDEQDDAKCAGVTITDSQCDAYFAVDITAHANMVNDLVNVPLSQLQFDALTSFVYAFGGVKFHDSTLLRFLNQYRYWSAADQFLRWNHEGAREVQGLENRRIAERAMFIAGTTR